MVNIWLEYYNNYRNVRCLAERDNAPSNCLETLDRMDKSTEDHRFALDTTGMPYAIEVPEIMIDSK